MSPTNAELRQFIVQFFNDEELETLAFDYFPEAANAFGSGMGKSRKVIALIGHCERHDRLADLHAAVARERPAAWNRQFAEPPVETFRRNVSTTTPQRDPRQIFLSHATADAEFAHQLADDLRAEGWQVWIAPESIRPGEKWVEAIDRGLETSGVFVVVLTPAAVASRWVNTETDAAVEMQHEGLITFIPLDVLACQPKRLWRQYQYVPFRSSYMAGLDALLGHLDDKTPLPFPPPWGGGVASPSRSSYIDQKTDIELIRIPAGTFLYGSADSDGMAYDDEKPQRMIELPEYWIGRNPVTNTQYKRFLDANPTYDVPFVDADWARPYNWDSKKRVYPDGKADHPVVLINWHDAQSFAEWAGLALPTEEEWEKAARGTDGRIWPWGDDPPTAEHCNFDRNVGATTPVGRYSPRGDSPYGCTDMAGNVWEWTASGNEARRVLRGGSWDGDQYDARAASRSNNLPSYRDHGCRLPAGAPSPISGALISVPGARAVASRAAMGFNDGKLQYLIGAYFRQYISRRSDYQRLGKAIDI